MSLVEKMSEGFGIVVYRLKNYGMGVTAWWAFDHVVRRLTGAPIRRVSQITPQLHVGGQYKRRGWPRLAARGVTAVVNMRIEFDDQKAGIAPKAYLHLPTVDDDAPSLAHLRQGVEFIRKNIDAGGGVYVHCKSGVGRAATMAVAYLIDAGLSSDEAWSMVRKARPFVKPTPVQLEQIERFRESIQS
ncbi:MAG: dual specificity protein phosphatase family protein [Anaerolineae bacterium]|nr:dual specificity protein phosphatase family protein [Anaerolineae bacterium]